MSFFRKLFGLQPAPDIKELVKNGALIIDVRSQAEFKGGHVKGAKCIPLDRISNEANRFKKETPIVLCCASGARSGAASRMLKSKGFTAYNAGSWTSLRNKIS